MEEIGKWVLSLKSTLCQQLIRHDLCLAALLSRRVTFVYKEVFVRERETEKFQQKLQF
jgi:hypothetical protein